MHQHSTNADCLRCRENTQGGVSLRAAQILLGHIRIETTVRYLGVGVEDALMLAEASDV